MQPAQIFAVGVKGHSRICWSQNFKYVHEVKTTGEAWDQLTWRKTTHRCVRHGGETDLENIDSKSVCVCVRECVIWVTKCLFYSQSEDLLAGPLTLFEG